MENLFKRHSWSPYAVGALLGLLMIFSMFMIKKWLGASGAFISVVAFFEHLVVSVHAKTSVFFAQEMGDSPLISFRVLLMLGVVLGAFISAKMSGTYVPSSIPVLWQERFGSCVAKRACIAFLGGVCVMLGAPLADGCTLSRGIFSGAMLDISGWIFMGVLFFAAVLTSFALYGVRRT